MDKVTVLEASVEAKRFIRTCDAVLARFRKESIERNISGTKETAACHRASLDLTRMLAQLRNSRLGKG